MTLNLVNQSQRILPWKL